MYTFENNARYNEVIYVKSPIKPINDKLNKLKTKKKDVKSRFKGRRKRVMASKLIKLQCDVKNWLPENDVMLQVIIEKFSLTTRQRELTLISPRFSNLNVRVKVLTRKNQPMRKKICLARVFSYIFYHKTLN